MTDNNVPNTDLKSGAEQDYGQFADCLSPLERCHDLMVT